MQLLSEMISFKVVFANVLMVFADAFTATSLELQITGDYGQLSSPNYPEMYPVNMICRWTINTVSGTRILLNFTDFKVEKNKKCLYDYLLIKETRNGWGKVSSKYCGHESIQTYLSQGNHLQIVFVSDELGNVDRGFIAHWTARDKAWKPFHSKTAAETEVSLERKKTNLTRLLSATETPHVTAIDPLKSTTCSCKGMLLNAKTVKEIDKKECNDNTAESISRSKRLLVVFGCLLLLLIIIGTTVIILICHRSDPRSILCNSKACLPRKTAKPWKKRRFCSGGSKGFRMVDGDIVVVSTDGKVLGQQQPHNNYSTVEESELLTVRDNMAPACRRMMLNDASFAFDTRERRCFTVHSDDMAEFYEFTSMSDAESDYY